MSRGGAQIFGGVLEISGGVRTPLHPPRKSAYDCQNPRKPRNTLKMSQKAMKTWILVDFFSKIAQLLGLLPQTPLTCIQTIISSSTQYIVI